LESIIKQNNFKSFYVNKYLVQSAKIIYNKNFIKKNKSYLVEFAPGKNGEEILLSGNREEVNILNESSEICVTNLVFSGEASTVLLFESSCIE
jgi:hypothetical protein